MGNNHLTVQWLRKYPSTPASTMTMRFLCLIALLPCLLCQDGPVEPTREPEPEPEPEAECMDGMEDVYSTETCGMLPANNWCDEKNYKGKCCASRKAFEDAKDATCFDEAKGCAYYKDDMCKRYPEECKLTCAVCEPGE